MPQPRLGLGLWALRSHEVRAAEVVDADALGLDQEGCQDLLSQLAGELEEVVIGGGRHP